MFKFFSEMTFFSILFYCVTFIGGIAAGIAIVRLERDGEHIALLRNLLNVARSGRHTASGAYLQMKERLEAWEDNQNVL